MFNPGGTRIGEISMGQTEISESGLSEQSNVWESWKHVDLLSRIISFKTLLFCISHIDYYLAIADLLEVSHDLLFCFFFHKKWSRFEKKKLLCKAFLKVILY